MFKYELAAAAGVSRNTFRRWLKNDRAALADLGVSAGTKLLPPAAVKYLCEKYDINEE
jgi:hypothetical protein